MVEKDLFINGNKENLAEQIKNWEEELQLFKTLDINKSAYSGKFIVDSNYQKSTEDGHKEFLYIQYTSKDSIIPIKSYLVVLREGKVIRIKATKKESSPVFKSRLEFAFVPDSGYSISGSQVLKAARPSAFYVGAKFR